MSENLKDIMHTEGTWFTFLIDGEIEVHLKIRPLTPEIYTSINERNIIRKKKKKWKIKGFNWESLGDEAIDYILEDFRGFGSSKDKPMENTLENKKKILSFKFCWNGKHMLDFIFEKAAELGGLKYNAAK